MAGKREIEEMKKFLLEDDFDAITRLLAPKERKLLDDLGIKSSEEFLGLFSLMGLDIDEVIRQALDADDGNLPDDSHFDEFDDDDEEGTGVASELSDLFMPNRMFLDLDDVSTYHLRVRLNDAPVKIWREIKVPSDITLDFLGLVIIHTMGWNGAHLYQFHHKGVRYVRADDEQDASVPIISLMPVDTRSADATALSDVLKKKGDHMRMEYDFGDCWMHEVWVKGIEKCDSEPDDAHIELVSGHGACPPDDCGGVHGYADLLSVVEKPRKTLDEKDMLEWFGMNDKHFDPEYFDLIATYRTLDNYLDYVDEAFGSNGSGNDGDDDDDEQVS